MGFNLVYFFRLCILKGAAEKETGTNEDGELLSELCLLDADEDGYGDASSFILMKMVQTVMTVMQMLEWVFGPIQMPMVMDLVMMIPSIMYVLWIQMTMVQMI